MYSVMAVFNSSIVWGLFEYTEFFMSPQRKRSGGERSGDLGGQGQGDTRLTLMPSAIPNSNYIIMVGD